MSRKLFAELGVRGRDGLPAQPPRPPPPASGHGKEEAGLHVLLLLEAFPTIPGKGTSIPGDLGLPLQTGWGGGRVPF